jgi:hypothetical protein
MTFDKQAYHHAYHRARKARVEALETAWQVFVRNAATITPLLSPQDQQALGDAFEVIEQ